MVGPLSGVTYNIDDSPRAPCRAVEAVTRELARRVAERVAAVDYRGDCDFGYCEGRIERIRGYRCDDLNSPPGGDGGAYFECRAGRHRFSGYTPNG